MAATDPALTALSQSWCALSLLHSRIEAHTEKALQHGHGLSVREYSLLDILSRQHDGPGGHLQMKQVADAVVLSQSATTRLVTRQEGRGLLTRYLCDTDRRGVYTDVTDTGLALLEAARPTNSAALRKLSTKRRPTRSSPRSCARSKASTSRPRPARRPAPPAPA